MKKYHRYPKRDARAGFSVFIIVIILAVAAGYAGTKYIIYPYLLSNPAGSTGEQGEGATTATEGAVGVITSVPSIIIDQQNLKNDTSEDISGNNSTGSGHGPFSVQFGSFSSKAGADALSLELSGKGIYSYVYESGGNHKVLGLPYSTEEKAKQAASVVSAVVSDVFVVNLSEIIP